MKKRMKRYIVVNLDPEMHSLRNQDIEKLKVVNARFIELRQKDKMVPLLKKADAILFTKTFISSDIIQNLEKCRIIVRFGTGLDNIDVRAATDKGIMVSRVVDFCTEEVSNHAFMLLLACSRKLKKFSFTGVCDGPIDDFRHIGSIYDETLGLIGFGTIARSLAKKAKCSGMKILAYDPFVEKKVFEKYGGEKVSLKKILQESDYVSLHCPLTEHTHHLIGEKELKLMKKTAYLINTSRGALIDEKMLIVALQKNWIAGAGLDVFEKEPPEQDNPLLHMENVICTPHYAYYSDKAIETLKTIAVDEIIRAMKGQIPRNLYNPAVLGMKKRR
ncbi:MAG TPA: C-terminal binding protein [bacterium]|nr:C-terminal binding protein [bacterium]HOL50353.1 C-terminal binding protein [bacterium]HPO52774.1 C-terminal binding protein [bacterium]HXK45147.1 C-terminal binding protein [bacterium]